MKQLYYTSCVPGRSKSGAGGYQVRAVSPNLGPDQQRALLRHVGYRLPAGYDDSTPPEKAPYRLALLHTDTGRVLCHSVHVGRDPTTDRAGVFFTHMLVEVPDSIDAGVASETWKASFWRTRDGDTGVDLPDLARIPGKGPLFPGKGLEECLREQKPLLRFLLAGALALPVDQRIFVVAAPEVVCRAVWCLSQLLPPFLLRQLTFSTYESDPLTCTARIVGTCWKGAENDLPSACYNGCGIACNTLTGKSSPLPELSGFAAVAMRLLETDRVQELLRFQGVCRDLDLGTLADHDLAWRLLGEPGALRSEDVQAASGNPRLAAQLLRQPQAIAQVVGFALEDRGFRDTVYGVLVKCGPEVAESLARQVYQEAVQALRQGQVERARIALDEVPGIGSASADAIVTDLAPDGLSWASRFFLLPRVLDSQTLQNDAGLRDRWLTVPPDQLASLLALPLSESAHLRAAALCIVRTRLEETGPALLAASAHGPLTLRLLRMLAREPPRPRVAVALVRVVLEQLQRGRALPWLQGARETPLEALIAQLWELAEQSGVALDVVDLCLVETIQAPACDPVEFIRRYASRLLAEPSPARSFVRLVERLASEQPRAAVDVAEVRDFIRNYGSHPGYSSLAPEVRARLEEQISLDDFLERPTLKAPLLLSVAEGLRASNNRREREGMARRVVAAVARSLATSPGEEVRENLETVLARLAPVASRGKSSLFGLIRQEASPDRWDGLLRELFELLLEDEKARENPYLLFHLVSVGLDHEIADPWVREHYWTSGKEGSAHDTEQFVRKIWPRLSSEVRQQLEGLIEQHWQEDACARGCWQKALTAEPPVESRKPLDWLWARRSKEEKS